jgi:hypothetical protein
VALTTLVVGGFVTTLAMLVVTISLSAKLLMSEFGVALARAPSVTASAAPATAVNAASAASSVLAPITATAANDPVSANANEAATNAMTAVGTAVAAVTLILSVGTSWFALRLKDLDAAKVNLDMLTSRLNAMVKLEAMVERATQLAAANQLLINARVSLQKWIGENSSLLETRNSLGLELPVRLQSLMSDSVEQRAEAFERLTEVLPDEPGNVLSSVDEYVKFCHKLHGGNAHTHGVWCDIFSAVERLAFAERGV